MFSGCRNKLYLMDVCETLTVSNPQNCVLGQDYLCFIPSLLQQTFILVFY